MVAFMTGLVACVFIISIAALIGIYMTYCNENEIGMFSGDGDKRTLNRIVNLEDRVEKLEKRY